MFKRTSADANLGRDTESSAAIFLSKNGLKLLTRNFRCKLGEIDLIMRDGDSIVFVEVRLRNNSRFGDGAASVTLKKQKKIIKTAMAYLQANPREAKLACRFDVLSAHHYQENQLQFDWIKDAFQTIAEPIF